MKHRGVKRFIIASVYLALIAGLAFLVYWANFYVPPVCTDGKQNGKETGVDCGGKCGACQEVVTGAPFELEEVAVMPGGSGRYDVLGKIYNPNDTEGASSFSYTVELKGANGESLAVQEGKSFILPQERKTVIEIGLESSVVPATAALRIDKIEWQRFSGYQDRPRINIYQKRYGEISGGVGFSEAFGLVSNESAYDFRKLQVKVILRDKSGKPLAANMTEMRTVASNEERDFRLVWPEAFPGVVEQVDMEADADFYNSDNFVRQYLPGGRFQEFSQ